MKKPMYDYEALKNSLIKNKENIVIFMKAIKEEQRIIEETNIYLSEHRKYNVWLKDQI